MKPFIAILILFLAILNLVSGQSAITQCYNGSATHYTGTSFMCGYNLVPTAQWRNTIPVYRGFAPDEPWLKMTDLLLRASCGECFQVVGPYGTSATLMVIDSCPTSSNTEWCSGKTSINSDHSSHFDLLTNGNNGAWEAIANGFSNTFNPIFRKVSCPISVNSNTNQAYPIRGYIGSGSSQYWMTIFFFDFAVGMKDVITITESGGTERSITKTSYNTFEIQAAVNAFKMPFVLKITSIFDEVVTVTISTTPAEGTIVDASANFKILTKLSSSSTDSMCISLPNLVIYREKLDPYQNTLKPTTGSDWRQMALWSGTTNYVSTAVTGLNSHKAVWEISLSGYGGINIGRDVKLLKSYIKSINMTIRASTSIAASSIYWVINGDETNPMKLPALSTSWTQVSMLIANNSAIPSEITMVGFKNPLSSSFTIYIDTMELILVDSSANTTSNVVPSSSIVVSSSATKPVSRSSSKNYRQTSVVSEGMKTLNCYILSVLFVVCLFMGINF